MSRPYRLQRPIGPYQTNHPEDVFAVKKNLYMNGYYRPAEGESPTAIGQNLVNSVHHYQYANGLKTDGMLFPGGETERSLSDEDEIAYTHRCRTCGAPHGGVFHPHYCADCLGKPK